MEKTLLVLADDLTGALDAGVQFAKKGIDVLVFPSVEAAEERGDDHPAVLVVNTDTRHAQAEDARSIVKKTAEAFDDYSFFYKKTDSCLRGNIGAELQALMEATKSARLPFVPAFPELKRITRGGCQYLDGNLIHKSSMANDPLNPIGESFIPTIIAKQSAVSVRLIARNGIIPAAHNPEETNPAEILVFDGETAGDLANAATMLWEEKLLRASAGCAGFAGALMETLPFDTNKKNNDKPMEQLPVLIVSGSLHEVSIQQVMCAREKKVAAFGLPGERIVRQSWLESDEAQAVAADCSRALLEKGVAILGTEASLGLTRRIPQGSAIAVSAVLGEVARAVIEKTSPLHLAVFGGDCLAGVIKTLRYNRLRPLEEIRPGIVFANAERQGRNEFIVTKAGAFGDINTIAVIVDFMKGK